MYFGIQFSSKAFYFCCRLELALQQNEIVDVFYDDWAALSLDDGSFGSKADNHLKVIAATSNVISCQRSLCIESAAFRFSDMANVFEHLPFLRSWLRRILAP